MVVKVYHAMIFDGYAPGSYEAKYQFYSLSSHVPKSSR